MNQDQDRSQLGQFWLPDRPDDRLYGVIDIERGNRPVLRLHGSFESDKRAVYSPGDIFHEVIYGYLQNPSEACSLHGVSFIFPGSGYSSAYVNAIVVGAPAASSELTQRCRYSVPLGLIVDDVNTSILLDGHQELVAKHEARRSSKITFDAAGTAVTIRSSAHIRYGTAEQTTQYGVVHRVDIVSRDPIEWTEIPRLFVMPLRDLVSLLRTVQPEVAEVSFEVEGDSYSVRGQPDAAETTHPRESAPDLSRGITFPQWQRGLDLPKQSERHTLYLPRLLRRIEGLDLQEALRRWWIWALDDTNHEVIRAANRSAGVEPRTGRDEFSDAIGALELYGDRLTSDGTAHRDRCARIMDLIPEDDPDRAWINERLRSGGGLGFNTKLKRLRDLHPSGHDLLGSDDDIRKAVAARSQLSHGKPPPAGFDLRDAARRMREFLIVLALDVGEGAPSSESISMD